MNGHGSGPIYLVSRAFWINFTNDFIGKDKELIRDCEVFVWFGITIYIDRVPPIQEIT